MDYRIGGVVGWVGCIFVACCFWVLISDCLGLLWFSVFVGILMLCIVGLGVCFGLGC